MADGYSMFDNLALTAEQERRLDSVLTMPSSALLPRTGKRPGPGLEVTVGGSPETAYLAAGGGVITDSTRGGPFPFVIPAQASKQLSARPGSGQSRYDVAYLLVKNQDAGVGDTGREVDFDVVTGSPSSGTPTLPSVPTGAIPVARLTVPATGTGVTVLPLLPRTVAAGAILPVASQAERDAISPLAGGQMVYREDLQTWETRDADSWSTVGGDTGWIPVPLEGAFVAVSSIQPAVRRLNGVAYWRGRVGRSGGFSATNYLIILAANLPSWALPASGDDLWRALAGDTPRGAVADGVVQSTGVSINLGSSATGTVSLSGLSGYPAS